MTSISLPAAASAIVAGVRAATASPTAVKERAASVVRKTYPNYKIIVLNDDFNTFQHVVSTLTKYIPNMTPDEAWNLANKIHNEGQAIVWVGPLEQAELYHSQLTRAGLTMAPLEKA
ncbi:MAG: ATP-dependent Clp protease adapter ClpS [Cyanobacteria bacterium J06626_23]